MSKKICFYVNSAKDKKVFELLDYYSNDIKIMRELGYEVITCSNTNEIPDDVDLFFIWWWTSGIIGLRYAKKKKKPALMIGNLHYSDPSTQGFFQRPFYIRWFIKYCLRNSDLQIATSKIEFEDIKKLNAKNPVWFYHCFDSRKYIFSDSPRENFLFTLTQLTKVNIERKKVYEIIKAYQKIKNDYPGLKLKIAGGKSDNGFSELEKYVNDNDLTDDVIFLGRVSDEEKIDLYRNCKIYIQPSDFEGFGMAIAEAMLCGAPVITSPAGAIPEVVGDKALLVNANNIDEISGAIKKLLDDDELYNKLHIEGYERIKNLFSYEERKFKIKNILEQYI
ncbi:MAG TPA: glycosyltransferase family 1 protein [Ignavibacteria bacterium]|nr:glycosyltransferase family 1 protein [Ignavibacteria bacterium]